MEILKQFMRSTFLLATIIVVASTAEGQDKELKGKVISATNLPLPYVSINIPGKGISTISNEEGIFVFKFQAGDGLTDSVTFSCVGYKSQTINIHDALKSNSLVVTLPESIVELKEVVIKPITIKELLDSIAQRNNKAFNTPMKLNGYYREFVFTNSKCNEYSDALFEYYYDSNLKNKGQLKIVASRCEKTVKKNEKNQNFEVFVDSKANPDKMFDFALLSGMIKQFFNDKQLENYKYSIEGNNSDKDLLVTIYPKSGTDKVYKLQFLLTDDFALRSYKLEIPGELLKSAKERSALGIHSKITAFTIEARYRAYDNGIYPQYFKIIKDVKLTGKFLGTVVDQLTAQRSEFVVTQINTKNISPIAKSEVYKKGNICDNGVAINTALLRNYNFILPTKKDSLAISSIEKDSSVN
jgi:hypothetical protein